MNTIYSAVYNGFHPLDVFFPNANCVAVDHPDQLIEKDAILIIHGGADISPSLYNQNAGPWTGADNAPSRRDLIEQDLVRAAQKMGIPVFGICRGAQLLCALAGGILVQDVSGHAGRGHYVSTHDDERIWVNSIHHQMQWPGDAPHVLLAQSTEPQSKEYLGEQSPLDFITYEPEAVWYPDLKGLGFQWHPEMMAAEAPANQWVRKQIKEYLHV